MARMASLADGAAFREVQQVVEARWLRKVNHALGMVGGRIIHARAAPGGGAGFLQLGALGSEANFGEAQEDEAENRLGILGLLEARASPQLVSGVPEAFFKRGVVLVFF